MYPLCVELYCVLSCTFTCFAFRVLFQEVVSQWGSVTMQLRVVTPGVFLSAQWRKGKRTLRGKAVQLVGAGPMCSRAGLIGGLTKCRVFLLAS